MVQKVLADGGYTGKAFASSVQESIGAEVEIAKRNELHRFAVLPKRWVIERSFSWLEKNRRLWKYCEHKLIREYFIHNIQFKYKTLIYKQFYHLKSRLLVGGFLSPAVSGFSASNEAFFLPQKSPWHWRGWQKRLGQGGDIDPEFFGQQSPVAAVGFGGDGVLGIDANPPQQKSGPDAVRHAVEGAAFGFGEVFHGGLGLWLGGRLYASHQ